MTRITVEEAWDILESLGTSEETLSVVTSINGYTVDTLADVLFAQYGYRSFEQLDSDEDEDEDEDGDDEHETCNGRGGTNDPRCGRRLGHDGPCDWTD